MASDQHVLRSIGAKATGGMLSLLLAWWAISLVASPAIVAYFFGGIEWAALTVIATFGVVIFIVKFAPYLLARAIAKIAAQDVKTAAKEIEEHE